MSNTKFTEGEWKFKLGSYGDWTIDMDGSTQMSSTTYYPWCPDNIYDWHLMASSPLLYKALEGALELAVSLMDDSYTWALEEEPRVIAARKALASAKGDNHDS